MPRARSVPARLSKAALTTCKKVFAALQVYVTAIIAEIGEKTPGSALDRRYLDQLLCGVSAEALRVFRDDAAEMRGQEHRRAS
jgi:hypothetical protein